MVCPHSGKGQRSKKTKLFLFWGCNVQITKQMWEKLSSAHDDVLDQFVTLTFWVRVFNKSWRLCNFWPSNQIERAFRMLSECKIICHFHANREHTFELSKTIKIWWTLVHLTFEKVGEASAINNLILGSDRKKNNCSLNLCYACFKQSDKLLKSSIRMLLPNIV